MDFHPAVFRPVLRNRHIIPITVRILRRNIIQANGPQTDPGNPAALKKSDHRRRPR